MSLFRAREWWSTKLGDGEEFDNGSMALGNVDNDTSGRVKIVTGSFQGMLRVHYPVNPDFRIEDLLLEEDLGAPILQVSVGRFIPAAPEVEAIAVLHPRKLGVYTVEAVGGTGTGASYFDLVKAYDHMLGAREEGHFTSFNMTHGGFGGVSRDLLCVQSMDGRLQIFEQDAHAFTRRLNGILAPGPLCYVAKIDAFVVGNSEMGVDCYKYQALAASQEITEKGVNEGISTARGLQAYWSCQLGEPALDLFVAKFSRALGPGCVDIVVVGERTLFTLREQGTIRLQKVLGYQPACACKYTVVAAPGEEGASLAGTTVREIDRRFAMVVEEENLVIATDTDQLMVYKDLQLVWQASLSRAPVAVTVAKLGAIPGIVCSLDDNGVLTAMYQGTDPPTSAVVAADTKEVDYDEINQEHRKLLQVIRRSRTDAARPPTGKLTLQVHVPRFLDDPGDRQQSEQSRQHGEGRAGKVFNEDAGRNPFGETSQISLHPPSAARFVQQQQQQQKADEVSVTARFVITYSGPEEVLDATFNICPPPGFSAEPSSALLPPIRGLGTQGGGGGTVAGGGWKGKRESAGGGENAPLVVTVALRADQGTGRLPSTLVGQASVVYTLQGKKGDGRSEPMSARCDLMVPLALAGRVVEPRATKGGTVHKFTFSTNRPAVPLSCLFEDIATLSSQTAPAGAGVGDGLSSSAARDSLSLENFKRNGAERWPAVPEEGGGDAAPASGINADSKAFSLRYWAAGPEAQEGSQDVTVAVSKNSGRYRVQGECLPALCVMATEVVRRLGEYFGEVGTGRDSGSGQQSLTMEDGKERPDEGSSRLRIEYTEPLPLQEFYDIIDEHLERRRDLQVASERLNRAAHQYRVVEKRLLSRFKDRNPAPLDNLDLVSGETYQRLLEHSEGVERAQGRLAVTAASLGCTVRLVALLAQIRFHLPRKDHAILLAHLFPDVTDTEDQGWEECVDAAMTHLLRTSLAKVAQGSAPSSVGQTLLSMPTDTAKLKKHISIVCDRLSKGARLDIRPASPPSGPRSASMKTVKPPGSPPSGGTTGRAST